MRQLIQPRREREDLFAIDDFDRRGALAAAAVRTRDVSFDDRRKRAKRKGLGGRFRQQVPTRGQLAIPAFRPPQSFLALPLQSVRFVDVVCVIGLRVLRRRHGHAPRGRDDFVNEGRSISEREHSTKVSDQERDPVREVAALAELG